MKRFTAEGRSSSFGLQAWRDMAIAMSRKYCRGLEFHTDEQDGDAEVDEDAIEDMQTGHGSHVTGMVYGRMVTEHVGQVASKRSLYARASLTWQQTVLGLMEDHSFQDEEEGNNEEERRLW